jgi:MYXO-CTERM domain-containing protein
MEGIERSGRKPNFSPWRLGDQRTCDGGEGEGSLGGEGPWGAALLTLGRSSRRRRKIWSGGRRLG